MSDQAQMNQAKLEKELVRRTRRLSDLYAALTTYHQVDDLDEMMELALKQVLVISGGGVGGIYLIDDACETLTLVAHQGIKATVLESIRHTPENDKLLCEMIRRKETLIVTEILAEPSLANIAKISGWDIFIGIPILNGKTAWGVLAVYGDKALQTNADEIELLEIIAGQIGIAVENSHLREQAERLAIVEERNRLARELHDSVVQSLYSLTLFAETAKRMMAAGDMAETRHCLDEIADSSQQALKEMRLQVYKLRPSRYPEGGLIAAIEQRLRAVEGRSGVEFDFQVNKTLTFRRDVENALYAITVEVLNNALKYARADRVRVKLTQDDKRIYLEVSDNGCGFDLAQTQQSGGLGLASIQERIAQLEGEIKIDSAPGKGTIIRAWIPKFDSKPGTA